MSTPPIQKSHHIRSNSAPELPFGLPLGLSKPKVEILPVARDILISGPSPRSANRPEPFHDEPTVPSP